MISHSVGAAPQAMLEPLVDVVDPNQVCTNVVGVREVDIMTTTVADLTFECSFVLRYGGSFARGRHHLLWWFTDISIPLLQTRQHGPG